MGESDITAHRTNSLPPQPTGVTTPATSTAITPPQPPGVRTPAATTQQDQLTYSRESAALSNSPVVQAFRSQLQARGIYSPKEINAQTAALMNYLAQSEEGKDYASLIADPAFQQALINQSETALSQMDRATARVEQAIERSGLSTDTEMQRRAGQRDNLLFNPSAGVNPITFALHILNNIQNDLIKDINLLFKEIKTKTTIRDALSEYSRYLADKSTELSHLTTKEKDEKNKNNVKVDVTIKTLSDANSISPSGQAYMSVTDNNKALNSSGLKAQTEKTGAMEKQISTEIDRLNQKVNNLYSQSEQNVSMMNTLMTNYYRNLAKISDNIR